MYIPEPYRITDDSEAVRFIRDNPFGMLITYSSEVLNTTLLPVMISKGMDGTVQLIGHMAAANQQSKTEPGSLCKMIFIGPHSYISPEWYTTPDVPTWNYISVEASGSIKWLNDEESYELIKKQMRHHEGAGSLNKNTEIMILGMISRIVCFVINVNTLEMCVKMSQKKADQEIRSIMNGLSSTNEPMCLKVAEIMGEVNLKGR